MMPTTDSPHQASRPRKEWIVTYTQRDVDAIREQIEQAEAAKRYWLVLVLIVTVAALIGAIVLLLTSYGLYSRSTAEKNRLAEENTALKSRTERLQQELDAIRAQQEKEAQLRAEMEAKLNKLRASALSSIANSREMGEFARMVYNLPQSRLELTQKPPDHIFRNWKVQSGSTTEVYTLVGGFVDGKWVIYSNLIARRTS
jgi:outer membrane murein-binding lipoprotein Lpp